MKIFFVMGLTCSGKSTMLETIKMYYDVGLIQVGKEMRRRHPPEYFGGLGAMPETEDEVWSIFLEQFEANNDKEIILVDGQPRMISQVEKCMDLKTDRQKFLVWLEVPKDVLLHRAQLRDDSDAGKELTAQRIVNDEKMYAHVLGYITLAGEHFHTIKNVTELLTLIYGAQ